MSQTVLVADDSKTIRQIVEMALKASAWEVVGVDSAQDAMQAARQSPSVILLDYYMPDGSGYDVCRALKQDSTTQTIPIVMLGGSFKQFDEDLARQAGADIVLMKPFKTDALLDALEEAQNAEMATPAPVATPDPPTEPDHRLGADHVEPGPITTESEPQLDLDSDSEETYGYGYDESSAGDEESSEPVYEAPTPEPDPAPAYAVPDRFPDDEDELPRPGANAQPRTPSEPARGSSPDINASSRAPSATSTPAPAAVAAPGLSREEIEILIRDEVKVAVKTELPGLLRNVMSEIFAQKIMPKLTEAADARVKATVNETMAAQIQTQVRAELERLLSEE